VREEISRGLLAGESCRVIARRFGRSPSTVSRDVSAPGIASGIAHGAQLKRPTGARTARRSRSCLPRRGFGASWNGGCDCDGPRSKSPHGWSSTIPTIWRCVCRTRRSINLCSRFAVGWAMRERVTDDLTLDAADMALARRRPRQGLLHHSDRGSQYARGDYQRVLKQHGIVCSMSRRGNRWDNAVAESVFATLKT
jgi:transposase InsO family protein